MALTAGFTEFIEELLSDFGRIEIRRMFGGAGVYRDGVGFGVLDHDVLYLKADGALGAELRSQGSEPWRYSVKKDGSVREVAYWSLPDTAVDDRDEAATLARRSFEVARRTAKTPAPKKSKRVAKSKKAARKKSAKKTTRRKSAAKTKH